MQVVEKKFPKVSKPVSGLLDKIEQRKAQAQRERRIQRNLSGAPSSILPQVVGGKILS
jgi:hypothetical protein